MAELTSKDWQVVDALLREATLGEWRRSLRPFEARAVLAVLADLTTPAEAGPDAEAQDG